MILAAEEASGMPLVSYLFRDDQRLQATLVSDRAHVTPGSSGPHVGKIQVAPSGLGQWQNYPGRAAKQDLWSDDGASGLNLQASAQDHQLQLRDGGG